MEKTLHSLRAFCLAIAVAAIACACSFGATEQALAADNGSTQLTVNASVTTQASSNGLVNGHVYVIKSALKNDYVLDISGASKANGANAQMYAFNATLAQQWKYTVDSSGRATLTCLASGKVLDVRGAGKSNGTNVWQYQSNGTNAQKWVISKNKNGTYTITSSLKSGLVLDVRGAGKSNGTNVHVWTANGTGAQQWKFYDVTKMRSDMAAQAKASAKTVAGKTYYIVSALNGKKVLDIAGGSKSNGANAQLYSANGTNAQKWTISFDNNGYATIKNGSGKVLDVRGASIASGTNVWQYQSNGTLAQKWIISKNSDGTYTFLSALWGGYALDVSGASEANGANVQIWESNGTKAQKWKLMTNVPVVKELSSSVKSSLWGISMQGVKAVGIDVSQWQGNIDWQEVADSGIEFAIIRCGYGSDWVSQDDWFFLQNVKGAKAAGLDLGVYLYSYAEDTSDAVSEANHTLRLLNKAGLRPSDLKYGVSYDVEDGSQAGLWLPGLCRAYCNKIKAAGYRVGVYSYLNWWNTKLDDPIMSNWDRWIAQWPTPTGNTTCSYNGKYVIWQFSSSGSVPGISGRVDMDLAY